MLVFVGIEDPMTEKPGVRLGNGMCLPEWQKYTMADGKIVQLSVPLLSEEPVMKSWKR